MPLELTQGKNGVFLSIHVSTGSSKNSIDGLFGNKLKVKIKSPPVDGKANEEIISYFAEFFGLPKRSVQIVKGATSKSKVLFLEGLTKETVLANLKV